METQPERHPIDKAALEFLNNVHVLRFKPDAQRAAFAYLHRRDHPDAVEERGAGGRAFNYPLAQQNAVEVLRRAEKIARDNGLVEVDEESVQFAIQGLCPGFYPFC
jgi:hypothetical protein